MEDETPIATSEHVRAIAESAIEVLYEIANEDPDDEDSKVNARRPLVFAALRFCALAAAELGDVSLFDVVADSLWLRVDHDFDSTGLHTDNDDAQVISDAASQLLALGIRVNEHVEKLAADDSVLARMTVAEGLKPLGPPEVALLRTLAKDTDPDVRKTAVESLRDVEETAWWVGRFPRDPERLMTEAEAISARPVLSRLVARLDAPLPNREAQWAVLARLTRRLPLIAAADVAEMLLAKADYSSQKVAKSLATLVFRGPSADAAIDRLMLAWAGPGDFSWLKKGIVAPLRRWPIQRTVSLCERLARGALAADPEARAELWSAAYVAACFAAEAWPRSADASAILDAVLALPAPDDDAEEDGISESANAKPTPHDCVVSQLAHILKHATPRSGPLLERIVVAYVSALHPQSSMRSEVEPFLSKLPDAALRPIAERAAASADPRVTCWSLGLLAGKLHDPKRDAPLPELLAGWTSSARLRRALVGSKDLGRRALPYLRPLLRARQLSLKEAFATMRAIGFVYGGFVERVSPEGREFRRLHRRALGPREHRGVATEAEWAAYRAARDAAPLGMGGDWHTALDVLPPGPWDPSDRALAEQALELVRAAPEKGPDWPLLSQALRDKPDRRALAMIDELLSVAVMDVRSLIRDDRVELVAALGGEEEEVEVEAPAPVQAAPAAPAIAALAEWMDEPEPDP